jgi:hypothetical protein
MVVQFRLSNPAAITVNPQIAPIIECVVDTGHPNFEAVITHNDEPMREHMNPSMRCCGIPSNKLTLTIPSLMVEVVEPPSSKAPPNSVKIAIAQAAGRVMALEPTDVAKEFATSFAPIPNASKNAKAIPSAKIQV